MKPLPNDVAGCIRGNCPRRLQCWRFVGAGNRERGVMFAPEVEDCEYFIEIEKEAA